MFGISLSKILLTGAVILAVWYGFKYLGRLGGRISGSDGDNDGTAATVEDLRRCDVCGTFVAPDATPICDRDDCPRR